MAIVPSGICPKLLLPAGKPAEHGAMHIGIIGTGTWGTATAFAACMAKDETTVTLWGRDMNKVGSLAAKRRHPRIPDHPLPDRVIVTANAADLQRVDALYWAVPTQYTRAMLQHLRDDISIARPLISLSKGLEEGSLLRLTELFAAELGAGGCYGCLSGPSHAEEVVQGLPGALVVAGPESACDAAVASFHGANLRIYTSDDLGGVELGGALKNVIAIAAGIADGLKLGDNAKAALVTRGVAEIRRLGLALGCDQATFAGLAGMGDLLTTCYSPFGRNRALGLAIAAGKSLEDHLAETGMVAEGAHTCRAAVALGDRHGVELPIASQVASMLWHGRPVREALSALLQRAHKDEIQ